MQDEKRLDAMLMRLFRLKGRTFDAGTIEAWREVLIRFEEDDLRKAFGHCLQADGFFEIKMVLDQLHGSPEQAAEDAWRYVIRAVRDGKEFKTLPPVIQETASKIGGWTEVRLGYATKIEESFKKAYSAIHNNGTDYDEIMRIEQ